MAEFFDKVKEEIEKGISTVSLKSKEVLESMKIKKEIETLEEKIKTATTELGQIVYSMYTKNKFDQVKIFETCEPIAALSNQLGGKKTELSELHFETGAALGKTYCSKCKTILAEGAQFCGACGEKVADPIGNPSA